MVERVLRETGALKEIENVVGRENILRGDLSKGSYPTRVVFTEKKSVQARAGGWAGTHDPKTHKIEIYNMNFKLKDLWMGLILGTTPRVLRYLDHELRHFLFRKEVEKVNRLSIRHVPQ